MPNTNGNAYGLTTLCPIKHGGKQGQTFTAQLRRHLDDLPTDERSPLAQVPQTYLSRMFILDRLPYQGLDLFKLWPQPITPKQDALQSNYLVYTSNFHGTDLDLYLRGFWKHAEAFARKTWQSCVGFEEVNDADDFIAYIKRCQVKTTFYFNGSNDEPLEKQLKGLYLKQELSNFAFTNQNLTPGQLQAAFKDFVEKTRPLDVQGPSFRPGASAIETAVAGQKPPRTTDPNPDPTLAQPPKPPSQTTNPTPSQASATSSKQPEQVNSAEVQAMQKPAARAASGTVVSDAQPAASTDRRTKKAKSGKGRRKSKQAEVA